MSLTIAKQHIREIFSGLKPLEVSETILLALFVVVYPWSWNVALWILIPLLVNAVVRMTAYRTVGNSYSKWGRIALYMPLALYGFYCLSMLYTSDVAEGFSILSHKLPMLIIPIYFLVGGLQFLSRKRVTFLGISFAAGCTTLAIYFILSRLWMIVFADASARILFNTHDIVPHHTYSAMYFLLSIAFLYLMERQHGDRMTAGTKALLWVSVGFLLVITFLIQSRSGVLCLVLLCIYALYDIFFNRKKRRLGLLLAGIVLGGVLASSLLLDDRFNRLNATVKEIASGNTEDVRFEIWSNACQVIQQNPLLGVGIGDRMTDLEANHRVQFYYSDKSWHPFNPHNQFLDTWVCVGILGFLTLIALFLIPFVLAWRSTPRHSLLLVFVFITAMAALVESVLERQMGVIFFCFAYCLLLLPACTETKTDVTGNADSCYK